MPSSIPMGQWGRDTVTTQIRDANINFLVYLSSQFICSTDVTGLWHIPGCTTDGCHATRSWSSDERESPMTRTDRQTVEHPWGTQKPEYKPVHSYRHTTLLLYTGVHPQEGHQWGVARAPERGEGCVTVLRTTPRQTEKI